MHEQQQTPFGPLANPSPSVHACRVPGQVLQLGRGLQTSRGLCTSISAKIDSDPGHLSVSN